MKKTTAIALIPAAALTVVAFSSCSVFDPDYKAYKEQQAAAATNAVPSPVNNPYGCLLYTSPSPRDGLLSRMPSSA